jgi:hypothetical protein
MRTLMAVVGWLALGGIGGAEQISGAGEKPITPEKLKAEIESLKPVKHVWREIAWKTCPLEALKDSRERNKPVITWVFLGLPSDERC